MFGGDGIAGTVGILREGEQPVAEYRAGSDDILTISVT